MAREDFAVRGMTPEMNPYEVSPLAVQGPVAAQDQTKANLLATPGVTVVPGSLDDLSQFGGLGGLDGYEANFSNAFGGSGSGQSSGPMSYAFPENYGNPKNKVYNLTAGPEDNIRLKFVDGTTMFEGKGPEAAAKAAAIVQELGKKFNTQSTWILDKQTAGGDWKQVSQDTVGTKKKTALNSFLDVVAPIAGSFLALVPGVGPALVGALGSAGTAAAGAGLGSLVNSGLQNQNSAEAFKKAALAAAGTYVGAKLGEIVKGGTNVAGGATKSLQVNMDDLQSALFDGLAGGEESILALAGYGRSAAEISKMLSISQDVVSNVIRSANPGAITDAVAKIAANAGSSEAANLTITALTKGTEGALTSAVAGGAGSAVVGGLTAGTSGVSGNQTTGRDTSTTGTDSNEVVVTGQETPLDTGVGLDVAGGIGGTGITTGTGTNTDFQVDTGENDADLEIEAEKKPDTKVETGVDPNLVVDTGTPAGPTGEDVVVTAETKPDSEVGLDIAGGLGGTGITSGVTTGPTTETGTKTPGDKKLDWKDVVTLVGLVGGAGGAGGGGGGGGGGGNTLTYPGGNQPGTPGSLGGVFTSKLPTPNPALAVTPRDMGQRDWLRYGFGPEASFFSNVPDRQALAVNPAPAAQMTPAAQTSPAPVAQTSPLAVNPTPSPVIEEMPALSEKLNEPTSDLAVKPDAQTAGVPSIGSKMPDMSLFENMRDNGRDPNWVPPPDPHANWTPEQRAEHKAAVKAAYDKATSEGWAAARGGSTDGAPHGGHGTSRKPRTEFAVHGAGTGRSDDIPAVLSDGEYVMDAETVALLGDGSSKAGAEKLDQLRVNLRRHKGANLAKGRFSVNAKSPEKYLTGGRV
jgi:hypothetical protein